MSDLTERLTRIWMDDHDRGCQGREYSCRCGFDEDAWKTAKEAADQIDRLTRELAEARDKALEEVAKHLDEKASGYEGEARDVRGSSADRRLCVSIAVRLRGSAAAIRALKEKP